LLSQILQAVKDREAPGLGNNISDYQNLHN